MLLFWVLLEDTLLLSEKWGPIIDAIGGQDKRSEKAGILFLRVVRSEGLEVVVHIIWNLSPAAEMNAPVAGGYDVWRWQPMVFRLTWMAIAFEGRRSVTTLGLCSLWN